MGPTGSVLAKIRTQTEVSVPRKREPVRFGLFTGSVFTGSAFSDSVFFEFGLGFLRFFRHQKMGRKQVVCMILA